LLLLFLVARTNISATSLQTLSNAALPQECYDLGTRCCAYRGPVTARHDATAEQLAALRAKKSEKGANA
jgi:hypothetical protein